VSYTPISKPPAPAGGVELRKAARKKVLLTGKIIWAEGAHILDCIILDVSATGARIKLRQAKTMPEAVFLLDMTNRMAHEAAVVSQRDGGFGMKFLNSYKLADIGSMRRARAQDAEKMVAPELRYLKRIWLEAAQ
jgi:hypothetical protein